MNPVLRFVCTYVAVSVLLGMLLLSEVFPYRPGSIAGWVILFVLAAPVTVAAEWVGGWMHSNPIAVKVERSTQATSFSWKRIGYFLAVSAVYLTVLFALTQKWLNH